MGTSIYDVGKTKLPMAKSISLLFLFVGKLLLFLEPSPPSFNIANVIGGDPRGHRRHPFVAADHEARVIGVFHE